MSFSLSGFSLIKRSEARPSSKARAALVAANRKAAQINSATSYKPGTVTQQKFDYNTQTWDDPSFESFTYNSDGSIATNTNEAFKIIYTYNEDKNVSKIEVYYKDSNSLLQSLEFEYDSIVKDYVVRQTTTSYYDGDPITEGYGVKITRNDDGNIIELQDYGFYQDLTDFYSDKIEIEYGADKKAIKVSYIEYLDGVPEIIEEWTNIVWERTDGQILSMEMDDPNADMYFSNNRVASADISSEDLPQLFRFTATYNGNSYHSKVMMDNERIFELDFKCIEKFPAREDFDECYSYDAELFEVDLDEDDGNFYIDYTRHITIKNRTNEFGIILENLNTDVYHDEDCDETTTESTIAEVTYDETYGYPLEVIYTETEEEFGDVDVEKRRILYSDYVLIENAGITSPSVDTDSPVEYYNMQGIRVNTPTEGLYIMRQNGISKKIYLRK